MVMLRVIGSAGRILLPSREKKSPLATRVKIPPHRRIQTRKAIVDWQSLALNESLELLI
jgi:hypothetical protein